MFTSNQNGGYQVYLRPPNNRPRQISNMKINEYIKHIEIVADLFVLSYNNKVDIYRYDGEQLQLVKSLAGYNKGVLSADTNTLLLTESVQENPQNRIVEMQLTDLQPTGLIIKDAKLAFYHNNNVIYLNQDNELIRLIDNKQQVITNNLDINSLEVTDLYGDKFYYVMRQSSHNEVGVIDLNTGMQTTLRSGEVTPSRIAVINEQLFIRVKQILRPKLLLGNIMEQ